MTGSSRTPALRELEARAADAAARGGMAVGPAARRLAAAAEVLGAWVAIRGRQLASDLRRDRMEPGTDGVAADSVRPQVDLDSGPWDPGTSTWADERWAAPGDPPPPTAPSADPDRDGR